MLTIMRRTRMRKLMKWSPLKMRRYKLFSLDVNKFFFMLPIFFSYIYMYVYIKDILYVFHMIRHVYVICQIRILMTLTTRSGAPSRGGSATSRWTRRRSRKRSPSSTSPTSLTPGLKGDAHIVMLWHMYRQERIQRGVSPPRAFLAVQENPPPERLRGGGTVHLMKKSSPLSSELRRGEIYFYMLNSPKSAKS